MNGDDNYPAEVSGYKYMHLGVDGVNAQLLIVEKSRERMKELLARGLKVQADIKYHEAELTALTKQWKFIVKESRVFT